MNNATTITTRTDLVTYLADCGGLDHDEIERVASVIQADDHPAWGDDWSEYLDGIDLATIATGGRFAAIGDDGTRPVVWGVGLSPDLARADARRWLAESGDGEHVGEADGMAIVTIDAARAALIEAGDVSAEGLAS